MGLGSLLRGGMWHRQALAGMGSRVGLPAAGEKILSPGRGAQGWPLGTSEQHRQEPDPQGRKKPHGRLQPRTNTVHEGQIPLDWWH